MLAINAPQLSPSRFPAGQILMTQGCYGLMQRGVINPIHYLRRHFAGDWGDLCDDDRDQNDLALLTGQDRLFSAYQVSEELKIWIITEWDRSVTTLLLPSEY